MKNETNVIKESYISGSYSHRERELKIGTNSLYLANKIDNVYHQRKSQTRCPGLTSSRRLLYIFSTQTTLEQISLLTRVASATTKSGRATKRWRRGSCTAEEKDKLEVILLHLEHRYPAISTDKWFNFTILS